MGRGSGAQDAAAGAHAVIAGANAYRQSQDSERDFNYKKGEDSKRESRQAIQDEIRKRFMDMQIQNMEIEKNLNANKLREQYPFFDTRPDDPKGENIPMGKAVPFTAVQKLEDENSSRKSAGFNPIASMDEYLNPRDVVAAKMATEKEQSQIDLNKSHSNYYNRPPAAGKSTFMDQMSQIDQVVPMIRQQQREANMMIQEGKASGNQDLVDQGQDALIAANIKQAHAMEVMKAGQKPVKNNITAKYNKATGQSYLEGSFEDADKAHDFLRAQSLAQAKQKSEEADADAAGAQTSFLDHIPFVSGYGNQHEKQAAAESAKAVLNKLQQYGKLAPAAQEAELATPSPDEISAAASSPAQRLNAAPPTVSGGASAEPVKISSKEEYAKLPSGTPYIGPDGKPAVKK